MTIPADEAMKKAAIAMARESARTNVSDRLLDAAIRALDAAGWQCVPKEMTAEMRDLVGKIEGATRAIQDRRCWNTALAAAPKLVEVKP